MCARWVQASAGGPGQRSPSPSADSGGTGSERVKQDSDVAGEGRGVQGIAGTPPGAFEQKSLTVRGALTAEAGR